MNPWLIGGLVLAILLGALRLHHVVAEAGRDEIRAEWAEANAAEEKRRAANVVAATDKKGKGDAKAKVIYTEITKAVGHYIDRPVYHNICLDDDGLRDARRALADPTASGADRALPPAARVAGWNGGVSLKMDYSSF